MLLHEKPFFGLNMLLHGDSKHDDVQTFFLLPLLTLILSYLLQIYDWRCWALRSAPRPVGCPQRHESKSLNHTMV